MVTDWTKLATELGSIHEHGETGGDDLTRLAFDQILGDEWIRDTVEHILAFRPGQELAMNCVRYIQSLKATQYAYEVYKSSAGERADRAVWLIKHLAHPVSFSWIAEFLNDRNVMHWGLGVLDQLLWGEKVPYDDAAKALLVLAEENSGGQMKGHIDFIRQYLEDRPKEEEDEGYSYCTVDVP
jgi:hypothetical protein